MKVSGTDVPIHERLLAALPDKAQEVTRSLHPEGLVDFEFRCEWKDAAKPHPIVTQDVRLKDCRIKFDHFRYPLQHVQGLATATDWRWKLENIEGRGVNDSTIVKLNGEANPGAAGYDVELNIDAWDVPLDDTLKLALPPPGQQAWDELRPQGRVDFRRMRRSPGIRRSQSLRLVCGRGRRRCLSNRGCFRIVWSKWMGRSPISEAASIARSSLRCMIARFIRRRRACGRPRRTAAGSLGCRM